MIELFSNNATTVLGAPLSIGGTSLTLFSGTGSEFPAPTSGQFFRLSLLDAFTQSVREILYCTARTGDVCTITRAQEGTSARGWLTGDFAMNAPTAGMWASFAQPPQVQQGAFNTATDTGIVNASVLTLSPAPTLAQNMEIAFTPAYANTVTNPTITVNGTVLPLTGPAGAALTVGQVPAAPISVMYSTTGGAHLELQGIIQSYHPSAGTIASWLGTAIPPGVIQWGITTLNVSRTSYAALFAQIGTTYGVGDGSTTFGLPAMPADYAVINLGGGTAGSSSVGSVLAHTHVLDGLLGNGSSGVPIWSQSGSLNLAYFSATHSTGGSINGAAGIRANFGFFY
jgi:hypothetical protein